MRHLKAITVGCSALLVLICLSVAAGEPRQNGHPLRYWLKQYWSASEEEQRSKSEAETAIRAIGAKKAVPELLRLVAVKDSPARRWLEKNSERYHLQFLAPRSVTEMQVDGITGFEVLGTNAAFATAQLTELLKDGELAFVAARCLEYLGKAAEPALCQCLTNQDSSVRELALAPLASVTDSVELYVERIKPLLGDPDSAVRCATVAAIGVQIEAPDLALPILIPALDSNDEGVVQAAAEQLGNFGTNACGALARLVLLAKESRPNPARVALEAIPKIAPSEAVGILSNTATNGNPKLMHTAITQLRAILPDLALCLLLDQLRSSDPLRKSAAIGVSGTYDATTPGLASALKNAAADSDPEISRRATITMRHLVQKQKEARGGRLEIAGEPDYQQKTLGQWLDLREREGGLSTNAVRALKQMGTNAIPALLARLTYREPIFDLPDDDVGLGAAFGLIALEEKAVPALPRLGTLVDSENERCALRAMIATMGTGVQAMPYVIAGLTNRHSLVRSEAAGLISGLGGRFPEVRNQAMPCLAALLNDPVYEVRVSATNRLREMDPKLAARLGIKPEPAVRVAPGR